jgi:hypothetical protein
MADINLTAPLDPSTPIVLSPAERMRNAAIELSMNHQGPLADYFAASAEALGPQIEFEKRRRSVAEANEQLASAQASFSPA